MLSDKALLHYYTTGDPLVVQRSPEELAALHRLLQKERVFFGVPSVIVGTTRPRIDIGHLVVERVPF